MTNETHKFRLFKLSWLKECWHFNIIHAYVSNSKWPQWCIEGIKFKVSKLKQSRLNSSAVNAKWCELAWNKLIYCQIPLFSLTISFSIFIFILALQIRCEHWTAFVVLHRWYLNAQNNHLKSYLIRFRVLKSLQHFINILCVV